MEHFVRCQPAPPVRAAGRSAAGCAAASAAPPGLLKSACRAICDSVDLSRKRGAFGLRLDLLLQKVERRLREKGIAQTRLPPPKVVIPLLEHATMEYENDLHTRLHRRSCHGPIKKDAMLPAAVRASTTPVATGAPELRRRVEARPRSVILAPSEQGDHSHPRFLPGSGGSPGL